VLRALARLQGERVDPVRCEEPGKILREHRAGREFDLPKCRRCAISNLLTRLPPNPPPRRGTPRRRRLPGVRRRRHPHGGNRVTAGPRAPGSARPPR
jgi:hypothetical protein